MAANPSPVSFIEMRRPDGKKLVHSMKNPQRQSRKKGSRKGPPPPRQEDIAKALSEHGFKADAGQIEALTAYLTALTAWNRLVNLVGHDHWREIFEDLVLDSLHLAGFLGELYPEAEDFPSTLDPGAGAGLPGIPLRIFWQAGSYLMIEPREKRAAFLQYALSRLTLLRTEALRARLEDVPAEKLPADLIISRAFMPWRELLDMAGEYLAENGRVVIMASEAPPNALSAAAFDFSGFTLEQSRAYPAGEKERFFWAFTLRRLPDRRRHQA